MNDLCRHIDWVHGTTPFLSDKQQNNVKCLVMWILRVRRQLPFSAITGTIHVSITLFLANFCLFCSSSPLYSFFLSETKCHCYFLSYLASPISFLSITLFSKCLISYLEKKLERFSSAKIAMLGKEVLYALYIPFFLQYLSSTMIQLFSV